MGMSKQTAALKLALEALEEIESYYGYDRSVGAMASSMYEASNLAKITSTRIREALAEQPAPVADPHKQQSAERVEPVAIVDAGDDGYWAEILPDRNVKVGQLLYTSPQPNKPWVHATTWRGLTDVEWMNIVNKDHAWFGQRPEDVAHEVAALVEAKLREKNEHREKNA